MVRATGFGSPAEAYIEDETDWTKILFPKPHAMYVFSVQGEGIKEKGIRSGDYLILDCSRRPATGSLVVAVIEGEFCLGEVEQSPGGPLIRSGSEVFPLSSSPEIRIFGVVTRLLRMLPA